MGDSLTFKLAAVQAAPVFFDRDASLEKACGLIEQAAEQGATLAAFGETWLPGYPFFTNYPADARWADLAARYLENGVEIPGPATDKLCETARRCGIDVVIGVVELDARTFGTAYCTLLFIGREGKILGRHRKLKPTRAERIMWGEGDGASLQVYGRPYARVSGLNCWEHNMVLPGYALMDQGTQVHVAAWPGGTGARQGFLSQAFASQGACYVICVGGLGREQDVPEAWRDLAGDWTGDSCIIDPWGNVIAGPVEGETILIAEGSLDLVRKAKAVCDVGGHYSRPDVFRLQVNRRAATRVVHEDVGLEPLAFASSNGSSESGADEDGLASASAVATLPGGRRPA